MIDLTSATYLGFTHGHAELAPWRALTTGRPSALDDRTRTLAARLAALVGLPRAVLAPSTLHIVTDLYAALPVDTIYLDPCAYAITKWGLERAQLRGVEILPLRGAVRPNSAIICDTVCVTCQRVAPMQTLHALARCSESWLIVDDSQGVGLLGESPSRGAPYGRGGGGTLRWAGTVRSHKTIVLGSCAKAFGVPLAFLAGEGSTVEWFERIAATRVHTSPCNAAELAALDAALRRNADDGDELRARLLRNIHRFRREAALRGATLDGGQFPLQTSPRLPRHVARTLESRLARRGIRALRLRAGHDNRLGFVVTAGHEPAAIDTAGAIIGETLARRTGCWS